MVHATGDRSAREAAVSAGRPLLVLGGRPLLVLAVDGVLLDTLPARAAALRAALQEVGATRVRDDAAVDDLDTIPPARLAGHDWAGAARGLLRATDRPADASADAPADAPFDAPADETLVDIVALAAERAYARALAIVPPLMYLDALARARAASERGVRVVLVSDSTRRAIGKLLDDLADRTLAARVIAADDVRPDARRPLRAVQLAMLAAHRDAAGRAHLVEAAHSAHSAHSAHAAHAHDASATDTDLDTWTPGWPAH